ncbi:MAG: hypothetical protein LBJ61_06265, partial [Deltaproteobacteria bacterium]|nr:hypothetical protein [Deltaproteobacteria bacterium]
TGLLRSFQQFWARLSAKFLTGLINHENAPLIMLACFLEKVVNGGALVTIDYADGLGFADIVVEYAGRKYVIELKMKGNERSRAKSLKQLLGYMDPLLVDEGWLIVFDRATGKTWKEKITWKTEKMPSGQVIHVVGC